MSFVEETISRVVGYFLAHEFGDPVVSMQTPAGGLGLASDPGVIALVAMGLIIVYLIIDRNINGGGRPRAGRRRGRR